MFTLRFSDEETLGNLERTAATLGVSTTELAEAAIERELTLVGSGQEQRLARALDRLRSAGPTDLDQDIQSFARGELEVEDPLRAYRVEARTQVQTEHGDQGELLRGKIDQTFTAFGEEIRNLARRVEELHATIDQLRPRVTPAAPVARETPAATAGKRSATPSSRGHS